MAKYLLRVEGARMIFSKPLSINIEINTSKTIFRNFMEEKGLFFTFKKNIIIFSFMKERDASLA